MQPSKTANMCCHPPLPLQCWFQQMYNIPKRLLYIYCNNCYKYYSYTYYTKFVHCQQIDEWWSWNVSTQHRKLDTPISYDNYVKMLAITYVGHISYSQHKWFHEQITTLTSPLSKYTVQTHSDRCTLRSSLAPTTVGCLHCEGVLLTSGHYPSWTCVAVCTTTKYLKCVNIPTQVIRARDVDKVGINCSTHAQWRLFPSDGELLSWDRKYHSWSPWSSWWGWEHSGKGVKQHVSAM